MTNAPAVIGSQLHTSQGQKAFLANGHPDGFMSSVDLRSSPVDIKAVNHSPPGLGSPESRGTTDSVDSIEGDYIKVLPVRLPGCGSDRSSSAMKQHIVPQDKNLQQQPTGSHQASDPLSADTPRDQAASQGEHSSVNTVGQDPRPRPADRPRRQVTRPINNNTAGPTGRYGGYTIPQAAAFPAGAQHYNQPHARSGARHVHFQIYHQESVGPQNVPMSPVMYAHVPYTQASVLPPAMYHQQTAQQYGYMVPPPHMWPSQYEASRPPQGPMRPSTAPTSNAPVTHPSFGLAYPHNEFMGGYFPQTSHLQQSAPDGGYFYSIPGYDAYMPAPPVYNAAFSYRGGQERSVNRALHFNAAQPANASATCTMYDSPPSIAVGDATRTRAGSRRQGPSPPRPMGDRLQIQKGKDAASRRHRRTRSNEEKISQAEGSAGSIVEAIKRDPSKESQLKKDITLKDIQGSVYELCKDQHGSRFLQDKIAKATPEEVVSAFEEVCVSVETTLALMMDVFGNYVVQKFLEYGTEAQQAHLAGVLKGNVMALSLQMYGCRVIQKAIEVLDLKFKIELVTELKGEVIDCVGDQNGNHVIQKCIECIPSEEIGFLLEELEIPRGNFEKRKVPSVTLPNKAPLVAGFDNLSRHPYGCRIVQRILEKCTIEDYKHRLVKKVTEDVMDLAQDTYGNYVIQHSLQFGSIAERSKIINTLKSNLVSLGKHKFASNVMEKCLEYGTEDERRMLVGLILKDSNEKSSGDDSALQTLTKDQYGNYVIQKALEECTMEERTVMKANIKDYLATLKKGQYSKHIIARVEKLLVPPPPETKKKDAQGCSSAQEGFVQKAVPLTPESE